MKLSGALFTVFALLAVSSCVLPVSQDGRAGDSGEIVVAAASNLTDAFAELGERFTRKSGVRVVYSFGATADLARQIENGAPFDVFAAADAKHVDDLLQQGLIVPGTRALYARGRLVLWVPEGGRARLSRIEEITNAEVGKIAIARPDIAPYGQAAVEALRVLNLWEEAEPRIVYGQSVSQAKQFASKGDADAAFIPRALVKAGEGQVIEVDERLHQPIEQALGVVQASGKHEAARRFLDFVLSPEGQELLERYGYRKPPT